MSDMLEKLLNVEKTAARLVTDAEVEAGRRTSQARAESQKAVSALLKEKAATAEEAVAAERARNVAERNRKNAEHRESLARTPLDVSDFKRAALSFLEKDSE